MRTGPKNDVEVAAQGPHGHHPTSRDVPCKFLHVRREHVVPEPDVPLKHGLHLVAVAPDLVRATAPAGALPLGAETGIGRRVRMTSVTPPRQPWVRNLRIETRGHNGMALGLNSPIPPVAKKNQAWGGGGGGGGAFRPTFAMMLMLYDPKKRQKPENRIRTRRRCSTRQALTASVNVHRGECAELVPPLD